MREIQVKMHPNFMFPFDEQEMEKLFNCKNFNYDLHVFQQNLRYSFM